METRHLGSSGLVVSLVGLGCNNFGGRMDFDASKAVVHRALELGITFFDTANVYGGAGRSEEFLGRILGDRRKEIVLATKFGKPMNGRLHGASRRIVLEAVEESLRRLQTDWIDLYYLHEPDRATPIEETLRALDDLVRSGKVRYIGCSNLPAWQVVEAHFTARGEHTSSFVACQDDYSLLYRGIERELVPAIEALGLGLVPFFPLASGLLTGKYRGATPPAEGRLAKYQDYGERYLTPPNIDTVERLDAFCAQRGHTLLELAFSWLACRPRVASVIAGATRPEQVEQNARAAGWMLTAEEIAEVDRITGVA